MLQRFARLAPAPALVVPILLAAAPVALAGEKTQIGPFIAEIDKLEAKVSPGGGEWLLRIEYEVELKRAGPVANADPLDLVINITDHGRIAVDANNEPLAIAISLDQPTKRKSSKTVFEGKLLVSLGASYPGDITNLRLHGKIVPTAAVEAAEVEQLNVAAQTPAPAAAQPMPTIHRAPRAVIAYSDDDDDERGEEVEFDDGIDRGGILHAASLGLSIAGFVTCIAR